MCLNCIDQTILIVMLMSILVNGKLFDFSEYFYIQFVYYDHIVVPLYVFILILLCLQLGIMTCINCWSIENKLHKIRNLERG